MKALTLMQPWAALVAYGLQDVETRNWWPRHLRPGERLAIHAGRTIADIKAMVVVEVEAVEGIFGLDWINRIERGMVLCTVRYRGAFRIKSVSNGEALGFDLISGLTVSMPVTRFGYWAPGRCIWLLSDVERLDAPVPARGRLGIWDWDQSAVLKAVAG